MAGFLTSVFLGLERIWLVSMIGRFVWFLSCVFRPEAEQTSRKYRQDERGKGGHSS